jgi:hypothetical protein
MLIKYSPLSDFVYKAQGYAFLVIWATGEPLNFSSAHLLQMSKLQTPFGVKDRPEHDDLPEEEQWNSRQPSWKATTLSSR